MITKKGTVDIDSELLWFISEWIYTFTQELTFSSPREVRKVIQDCVEEFNNKKPKPHVDEILKSLEDQNMVDSKTIEDVKKYWLNDQGYKTIQEKYRDNTVQDVDDLMTTERCEQ